MTQNNTILMRYFLLLFGLYAFSQNVGIGTNNPTHRLHLANVSSTDLGVMRIQSLSSPHGSLATFSSIGVMEKINFTGNAVDLLQGSLTWGPDPTDWRLVGNTGTNPASHFLGTTDNQNLIFRTSGTERMRVLTDGRVFIGTTYDTTPNNNTLIIRSRDAATAKGLVARSDTIGICGVIEDGLGPGVVGYYYSTAISGIGFFARGNNLTGPIPTIINPAPFVAQGSAHGIMGEARSTTASPRQGGIFSNASGSITARVAAVIGPNEYKINGVGTVNTVIQDGQGGVRMLTAPEAPQFLFQDFGEAALANGVAFIPIEPKLLPHIQYDKLLAWVTPLGPCQGLYVQLTDRGGFYVREKNGGRSNTRFMWAWSAPVRGWERFPAASPPPPVAKGRP